MKENSAFIFKTGMLKQINGTNRTQVNLLYRNYFKPYFSSIFSV